MSDGQFDALCRECETVVSVEVVVTIVAILADGDIEPDRSDATGTVRCGECHSGQLYKLDENGLEMEFSERTYLMGYYQIFNGLDLIDKAINLAMM